MEIKFSEKFTTWLDKFRGLFTKKVQFSSKNELNLSNLRYLAMGFILLFVCIVLLMPNESPVQFTEKIKSNKVDVIAKEETSQGRNVSSTQLWATPSRDTYRSYGGGGNFSINYNTAMVVGAGSNSKTQLHAGFRLPLRILDKVVVSQDSVPVLAELLLNSETESGLKLEAGTRFYGEATFSKGSDRAQVTFKQVALSSGQLKPINANALGKDGQPGVSGKVFSDGTKNTAGQVLTSFVSGLAAGSVQTDMFGRSQGGIGNGLLTAVADTARSRAQDYGEKLKIEREWLEINPNTECDAQLFEAMDLQSGSSNAE